MNLTVREVAKLLTVTEKTIYRWINQGTIPAYRVSDQYRFNRAEILEWATSRKINVSADLFEEPESSKHPRATLLEALRAGGIYYRLSDNDKETAFRSIVETIRLPEEVDREFLLRVLLAREGLESTGIGDGIAIPHVRNPLVLHIQKPMVSLCYLEKPIDFGALDGKPVFALFMLITPTVRSHLHLLSRLSFALRDPQLKELILRQASREELIEGFRRIEAGLEPTLPAPVAE